MESKYIKGTDKQYSIREDETIIKNYNNTKYGTKSYNKRVLRVHNGLGSIYKQKKKNSVSVAYLMFDYFGYRYCNKCDYKIPNREQKTCNKCQRKVQSKFDVIKKQRITRSYAASMMNIKIFDLSDEMYNLYKANLLVKRKLSEKTGIPTNLIK